MPSKRAAIFKTVLEYVNSDDWVDMGEFLVFGKAAFEAHIEGDDLSMNKNTRELANKLKTNRGVREVVSRTSMRQPPKDNTVEALTDFGKKLPETTLRNILAVLDSQGKSQPSAPIDSDDAIDAALALTLIENLGKAAQRVQSLDSVEFQPASFYTADYFEEAHRCDLFGLKIAAAVLCRAVLEDSLRKIIDPRGQIRQRIKENKSNPDSYLSAMLDEAVKMKRLDKSRAGMGEEIKKAGNKAAHDLAAFKSRYATRITEIVDGMRKVLEDLHGSS